jgi:hypothetical protein
VQKKMEPLLFASLVKEGFIIWGSCQARAKWLAGLHHSP